ncbi:MAG: hypothetical protein E6G92_08980 [Alphaproteobacteria bacterium]|nr:MAG: hypothetical protein E6G92_08980 [Alphaproteobacteria bacterium]
MGSAAIARSVATKQSSGLGVSAGLLRYARNDDEKIGDRPRFQPMLARSSRGESRWTIARATK